MLLKRNRLPIASVTSPPIASYRTRYFSVRRFPRSGALNRFAIVIGKRVFKKAVSRNRMRRAIYHFIARDLETFPSSDLLVVMEPSAGALEKEMLEKEFFGAIRGVFPPRPLKPPHHLR